MKHHHKQWLALAVAVAVGGMTGCSGDSGKGGEAGKPGAAAPGGGMALPVTILEARPQSVPASIELVGQTEGAREVEVRARIGGILQQRLYQEGDSVKAGQPLFRIDPAPFEIALAQARAQRAELAAKSEQATREARRLQGLLAQQAVSQREHDDAQSAAAMAVASLQASDAKVREAELNLSYTTVTAPVAGVTGRALRSEGSLVTAGSDSLLTTLVQVNPLWVRFSAGEGELSQVAGKRLTARTVKAVELIMPDGSVLPTKGRINFIASQLDPKLGTQSLRAEFDNPEGALLPGQFVRVRVQTGMRDGVFLVPQTAVMQGEQGRFVYVVGDKDVVQPRPVKTGEWRGKDWVILDGLKPGERIAVDNLIKLRPGATVKPLQPGAAPAAPASAPAAPSTGTAAPPASTAVSTSPASGTAPAQPAAPASANGR